MNTSEKSAEGLYDEGYALLRSGKYEDALIALDAAIATSSVEAQMWQHELWDYKGQALAKLGRLIEAIRAFESALSLLRSVETLTNLGDSLRALGDVVAARRAYHEALQMSLPGEDIRDRIHLGLDHCHGELG